MHARPVAFVATTPELAAPSSRGFDGLRRGLVARSEAKTSAESGAVETESKNTRSVGHRSLVPTDRRAKRTDASVLQMSRGSYSTTSEVAGRRADSAGPSLQWVRL